MTDLVHEAGPTSAPDGVDEAAVAAAAALEARLAEIEDRAARAAGRELSVIGGSIVAVTLLDSPENVWTDRMRPVGMAQERGVRRFVTETGFTGGSLEVTDMVPTASKGIKYRTAIEFLGGAMLDEEKILVIAKRITSEQEYKDHAYLGQTFTALAVSVKGGEKALKAFPGRWGIGLHDKTIGYLLERKAAVYPEISLW